MPSTEQKPGPHSLSERVFGHLELSRISNGPTVVTNTLAGAILAGQSPLDGRLIPLVVALLSLYVGGMYMNDVCDFRFDREKRKGRPLVRGVVSRKEAAVSVAAYFGLAGLLVGWFVPAALPGAALLAVLIVAYNVWHKDNPLAPLLMGGIRGMVYVTAFSAFATPSLAALWTWAGLLALYVVGVTALARAETDPTETSLVPAALLTAPALYFLWSIPSVVWLPLAFVFGGWTAHSIRHASRQGGRDIPRAIGGLLAGICLLDALVLASCGQLWAVCVALLCFGLTLFFHRYVKGT